jgi:hypothetical protein
MSDIEPYSMDGDIILYSVVLLFIVFIFFVPPLLYAGLKKMKDPVPPALPLLISAAVLLLLTFIRKAALISDDNVLAGTVITFSFLLLLVDLAVIAPYPYFAKKIGFENPWQVFTLLAFVGAGLLFYTTAGEAYYGRPMPPFSAPLPLTGWILDGAAGILGIQDAVYAFGSPVYPLLMATGLYLEVLVLAILYYWILGLSAKTGDAKRNG